MEITLTPEMEALLNEEMAAGDYVSPADVLREGLLSLRARRIPKSVRLENLRREIQKGVDAIQKGDFQVYESADAMIEDVIQEARSEFELTNGNGK